MLDTQRPNRRSKLIPDLKEDIVHSVNTLIKNYNSAVKYKKSKH